MDEGFYNRLEERRRAHFVTFISTLVEIGNALGQTKGKTEGKAAFMTAAYELDLRNQELGLMYQPNQPKLYSILEVHKVHLESACDENKARSAGKIEF